MKGSLIIVAFFAAGILCGRADVLPQWVSSSTVSMTALCALLLCVGMGIGSNPDMKSEFRSLNPRVALLPLATILGSWAGAAIAFLVLQRTITDCLAISSGFAYYSLVSVSAMLVYTRQKNIAQVFILERYFFVSIYPAAILGTCLSVFLVAVLQLC